MKYINLVIFVVVLTKVLLSGISTTIESYYSFYKIERSEFLNKMIKVNNIGSFIWFYTGLDTGYGFFAPNVSSNFIIISESNNLLSSSDNLLNTKEGKLRFVSINSIFLENVREGFNNTNKEKLQYNHIILKQINNHYKKKYGLSEVETKVFLYDFPRLIDKKENIKLIPIDSVK